MTLERAIKKWFLILLDVSLILMYLYITSIAVTFTDKYLSIRTRLPKDHYLYGLGEHATPYFRLQPRMYTMWAYDAPTPQYSNLCMYVCRKLYFFSFVLSACYRWFSYLKVGNWHIESRKLTYIDNQLTVFIIGSSSIQQSCFLYFLLCQLW